MDSKSRIFPTMPVIFFLTFNLFCGHFPSLVYSQFLPPTDLDHQEFKENNLKAYIVHVKKPESKTFIDSENLESYYKSFLPVSSNQHERMLYSYRNVVSGFAARLTEEELKEIKKKEGFISAKPERIIPLLTTETPNFLGLHQGMGFWNSTNYGKGVIVGLLDTGILPYHPSFSDKGMPPPPAKWKGRCDFGSACNNKLIGARTFLAGYNATGKPPTDDIGHGTHTASTAAGNFVDGANILGFANGTATGMAPLAHLAMYKVCAGFGCAYTDILAAFDSAVEDGVDILSLSLGGPSIPFYEDTIAIGAFGAIRKGIFVSCAAGNSGPSNTSLSNEAPWILTVGATTVDRSIMATAQLGNGAEYDGQSLFQPKDFNSSLLPLVYPGSNGNYTTALCGSLQDFDVKGKIVVCEGGGYGTSQGQAVKDAGGAGMILIDEEYQGYSTSAELHVLPTSEVNYFDGLKIKEYINSTSTPTASIVFKGTVVGIPSAPIVADFSSRGPSFSSPGILKPDIVAPGVNVLAAYPWSYNDTSSNSSFAFLSGTSMACPHLGGIAALLKSSHPDWSPAAIKSAIITSAKTENLGGKPITDNFLQPANVFAIGGGLVNPSRANDPGLVYDVQPDDYVPYLCGLGYQDDEVGIIAHHNVTCTKENSIPEAQLNYPSFSIILGSKNQTYTRTVTNVGPAVSSYNAEIYQPQGVVVTVDPINLDFSKVNQKLTYTVTFSKSSEGNSSTFSEGALQWVSGKHTVRSPIAVIFK